MAKVKKQTYTLEMYLQKVQDLDIRSDADVQRLSGAWNNSMASELIVSVLNSEYVPALILGTEENSQSWIIDGCQRTSTLMMFRYGNLKIGSNVEEPIIKYKAKLRDADGNILIDGCGDICWESREFDIRRKTYERLPEELKKRFNEFQVETVIHENYSMQQISRLVRRFNFNKPMNVSQKTFTFCDRYARRIREILKRNFFIECAGYTKNERRNGAVERIIMESIMVMYHLDSWKKAGQIGQYLNDNATMEEFDSLENNIARLEEVITDDLYPLFNAKDTFLLFTLFHKFTRLGLDDGKFVDFLMHFKEMADEIDMNEFYGVDKNSSTKDKNIIIKKLGKLEMLMREYFGIPELEEEPEMDSESILKFVRENVSSYTTMEDILQYSEVLNCLLEKSNCDGKLLEVENKPSLIALIGYSFKNDIDLDDWIADFCSRNDDYIEDQLENFECMKDDLQQFLELENAA